MKTTPPPAPEIPAHEIWFEFSASPGPGGQNVNHRQTQAALCFAPAGSGALTLAQKQRVLGALRNRIDGAGILRIVCHEARTQAQNRALALERFAALLAEALRPRKTRRATRPSRGARERRMQAKKRTAERKQNRRHAGGDAEG